MDATIAYGEFGRSSVDFAPEVRFSIIDDDADSERSSPGRADLCVRVGKPVNSLSTIQATAAGSTRVLIGRTAERN